MGHISGQMRYSYTRVDSASGVSRADDSKQPEFSALKVNEQPQQDPVIYGDDEVSKSNEIFVVPTSRQRWHRLSGWRVGAAIAMTGAFVTLTVNIAVAAYGLSHQTSKSTDSNILVELFHGDCKKASTLNTYAHLLINVISTLLLSGSNYCMQCLVAPTRKDVDAVHAKMRWLDIGVPSLRNLTHMSTGRRWLWSLLVISSLPLHLMFNSVFFTSIATNDYNVVFATENFTTGANFSTANGFNTRYFQPPSYKEDLSSVQQQIARSEFERLENADCIRAYAVDLLTERRTLVLISSNSSTHGNGAVLGSGNQEYVKPERWYTLQEGYNPYTWLCGERDSAVLNVKGAYSYGYGPYCYKYADKLLENPDVWAPSDWTPEYCLSEKVDGQCSCMVNLVIVWIVIACNIIKMIVMGIVAFSNTLDQPLCTVGDAITSFVTDPDPTTTDMCIVTREYMRMYNMALKNEPHVNKVLLEKDADYHHFISGATNWKPPVPQTWHSKKKFYWWNAPSSARWWWAILFYTACMITTIGLLGRAISFYTGDKSLSALANIGLGHPTSQTMITGWYVKHCCLVADNFANT